MCFSAQASFAAGAALLPAGLYCVNVALRRRRAALPLAVVPLVFSFQQFCEGLVWVGLASGDAALVKAASLTFLAVALGFWPFWVPLSVRSLEDRRGVRRSLNAGALLGLALGCALYLPMALRADEWLRVSLAHHSIIYNPWGLPAFGVMHPRFWDAAYGAAVLVPFFLVSAGRRLAAFRALLVVSVVLSLVLYRHAFVSVWCFFAALLSGQLCYTFAGFGEYHHTGRGTTIPLHSPPRAVQ